MFVTRFDDESNGIGAIERGRRGGQVGAVQSARTVDVRGCVEFATDRSIGSRVHGDGEAEHVAQDEGVVRGAVERSVPGNGGDSDQLGVARCDHDGNDVVMTGIAVE